MNDFPDHLTCTRQGGKLICGQIAMCSAANQEHDRWLLLDYVYFYPFVRLQPCFREREIDHGIANIEVPLFMNIF